MTVRELNCDQLDELRDSLYWIWLDEGKIDVDKFDGITDEELFEYYNGIDFVPDDFWCSVGV